MKIRFHKRPLISLVIAIVLSLGIIRTQQLQPVSPCVNTPGCTDYSMVGKLATTQYGYPLSYKETKQFSPTNSSRYATMSVETQSLSLVSIAIDIVFWFALVDTVLRLALRQAGGKIPAPISNIDA